MGEHEQARTDTAYSRTADADFVKILVRSFASHQLLWAQGPPLPCHLYISARSTLGQLRFASLFRKAD
eukprot:7378168-Prymnesium_polylepis.1